MPARLAWNMICICICICILFEFVNARNAGIKHLLYLWKLFFLVLHSRHNSSKFPAWNWFWPWFSYSHKLCISKVNTIRWPCPDNFHTPSITLLKKNLTIIHGAFSRNYNDLLGKKVINHLVQISLSWFFVSYISSCP